MRSINVPLTDPERDQLLDLASAERRDARSQAGLLLSRALAAATGAQQPNAAVFSAAPARAEGGAQ
jgi:hypothetical protein